MPDPSPVFERHYQHYLSRVGQLDFDRTGPAAGAKVLSEGRDRVLALDYFNTRYRVSGRGVAGPDGRPAAYDTCTILSRYLIMAADRGSGPTHGAAGPGEWVSFRDLRDAGPLTVYFRDNVEAVISQALAGNAGRAGQSLSGMGGTVPDLGARYDIMLEFRGLPHISMLLLFNDAEDGFPPSCSVLFRPDVEIHLDAECIAMMGYRLAAMVRESMVSGA